ncbi:flagellin [Neorhizobium galegae]|uniref:flagellin N-terminal helical domain-containing protein n=1 Tax=Neorhizobium galegae TaxID=399 RepID=UPI001AE53A38|nr:flagellin [Neorhizobium galegae]
MTSILTNTGAISALQTLRAVNAQLSQTQGEVASGLRIADAADNAAYWSIATTMRSDSQAISAVGDALNLGSATVGVAYAGLDSAISVLDEFKAKLVAASEPGVDRRKVQKELDQLNGQIESIAASASFNGQNWLKTTYTDNLLDTTQNLKTELVASFARTGGSVEISTMAVDLGKTSLLNTGGGGILQKEPWALGDIGGFRDVSINSFAHNGHEDHNFTGPATLSPTDSISFDITVDSGTHSPGVTATVTLTKADVDAALGTTTGTIQTAEDYRRVLETYFQANSIPATAYSNWSHGVNGIEIGSKETSGEPGSSIFLSNFSSTLPGNTALGLENPAGLDHDNMYPSGSLSFSGAFQVHRTASISFDVAIGPHAVSTVTIDRDMVNTALGITNGTVSTAADLATVINYAASGTDLFASATGNFIQFGADQTVFPDAGNRAAHVYLGNVRDNLGYALDFDLAEVDITTPKADIAHYLEGVDFMLQRMTDAASNLGATENRLSLQTEFAKGLVETLDTGVGLLVDADLDEASARLKAEQTRQQLGIQALSIANSSTQNLLKLFQ